MEKLVLMVLLAFYATPGVGDEVKVVNPNPPSEGRNGVRAEYDALIKDSGEWGYIAKTAYTLGILSACGSYYSYNRGLYYSDLSNKRTLSPHEIQQQEMWQSLSNNTGYGAAALVGIGVFGSVMDLHYENKAHSFALDMGVRF